MILADTSVVIECERALTARLRRIIHDNDAAVCGVNIAEMFVAVRSPSTDASVRAALALFQRVTVLEATWEAAGRNQARLRAGGLTVGLPDTIISTVAITAGIELWTYDAHFTAMAARLPGLSLFQGPP